MTEIEKLQHAREYISKLANGIDPLTNQAVPGNDIINNVRISRCLFYVSDVLRQVIEDGSPGRKAKVKKAPFELSYEERAKFRFSASPITITEIAKRINDLIDAERMSKLSINAISCWLDELGLLNKTTGSDGKTVKRPTPKGAEFGISTERRQGLDRIYTVTVYDRSAQQFIIDNLDAVIEFSRGKPPEDGKNSTAQ